MRVHRDIRETRRPRTRVPTTADLRFLQRRELEASEKEGKLMQPWPVGWDGMAYRASSGKHGVKGVIERDACASTMNLRRRWAHAIRKNPKLDICAYA